MSKITYSTTLCLLEEWACFLNSQADYQTNSNEARLIRNEINYFQPIGEKIKRILQHPSETNICFVGKGNVGKSTLLNSILGRDHIILPERNGPCTQTIYECKQSDLFQVTIKKSDSITSVRREFEYLNLMSRYIKDSTILNDESLEKIIVESPTFTLGAQLRLIDTPGFAAAHDGRGQEHEQILQEAIKLHSTHVVWVVQASHGGITKEEHNYYKNFLDEICDLIVVTGCDPVGEWGELNRTRFIDRFASHIDLSMSQWFFVSGKEAQRALELEDDTRYSNSGVPDLVEAIQELSTSDWESKFCQQIWESMYQRSMDLYEHITENSLPYRTDLLHKEALSYLLKGWKI